MTVCVCLKIVVRRLTQRMWGRNYNLSQLYWLDRRGLRRSKQLLKDPANTEALHISNQSSNPVNATLIKVKELNEGVYKPPGLMALFLESA